MSFPPVWGRSCLCQQSRCGSPFQSLPSGADIRGTWLELSLDTVSAGDFISTFLFFYSSPLHIWAVLQTGLHLQYVGSSLAHDGQRCILLQASVREHSSATASHGWESSDHSLTDPAFSSRIPGLAPRLLAETGGKHMPVRVFMGGGL